MDSVQRSFDDMERAAKKAAQEAKFTVDDNQVEIEADFGRIRITNCGNFAQVYIDRYDVRLALIPTACNTFEIVVIPKQR